MSPVVDRLPKVPTYRLACNSCHESRNKCSQTRPVCERCERLDKPCVYGLSQRTGRKKASELSRAIARLNSRRAALEFEIAAAFPPLLPQDDVGAQQIEDSMNPLNRRSFPQHRQLPQPHPGFHMPFPPTSHPNPTMMAGHPFDTVNFPGMVGMAPPPPSMIHHQPSGEAIELGPGSNERTETVSPSMLSSTTSHQQEECQCSDEIVSFLHERKGVTAEPEASVERLSKVGEEAAQFLSKVVGCRRSKHRAYSNFFGLLMLVDQTLRIYQKLNASAEAALPGSSQSTVVGNMFTTDAANSVSGFGRDHMSMNDALNSPFNYSQYAAGSPFEQGFRPPSLTAMDITGFSGEHTNSEAEVDNGEVFAALNSACEHLESVRESIRALKMNLARLDAGPPLNVGQAVYILPDDPVPPLIQLVQRMEEKRARVHGQIAAKVRDESQQA